MLRNSDAVHGGFSTIVGSIYKRKWQCGVRIACDNLQPRKLGGRKATCRAVWYAL